MQSGWDGCWLIFQRVTQSLWNGDEGALEARKCHPLPCGRTFVCIFTGVSAVWEYLINGVAHLWWFNPGGLASVNWD